MKDTSNPPLRQHERLFGTITKSESCSRAFSDLLDKFEKESSKLALQILFHLLRYHDYRASLPSQSAIAEKLEASQGHVSRSFVELVEYGIVFRCRVKEFKAKEKIEYFLNPHLFWDRSEAERQERINWIRHTLEPRRKKAMARKKPAPRPKNVIDFPQLFPKIKKVK